MAPVRTADIEISHAFCVPTAVRLTSITISTPSRHVFDAATCTGCRTSTPTRRFTGLIPKLHGGVAMQSPIDASALIQAGCAWLAPVPQAWLSASAHGIRCGRADRSRNDDSAELAECEKESSLGASCTSPGRLMHSRTARPQGCGWPPASPIYTTAGSLHQRTCASPVRYAVLYPLDGRKRLVSQM